jgi:hypothetical protein
MGVNIPDNDFAAIEILRDLEASRNDLADKHASTQNYSDTLFIENNVGNSNHVSMDWNPTSDNEEPFTVLRNKGKKASRKKPIVIISRPNTRSQSNKDLFLVTNLPQFLAGSLENTLSRVVLNERCPLEQ